MKPTMKLATTQNQKNEGTLDSIMHMEALNTIGLSQKELAEKRLLEKKEKYKLGIPPSDYFEKNRDTNALNLMKVCDLLPSLPLQLILCRSSMKGRTKGKILFAIKFNSGRSRYLSMSLFSQLYRSIKNTRSPIWMRRKVNFCKIQCEGTENMNSF